nr:hypothetical protein [Tanacetum cinerariifolium]
MKDAGFWTEVLQYMESKTKMYCRRAYDMVNGKWKTLRLNVVRFCEVYGNIMRRLQESELETKITIIGHFLTMKLKPECRLNFVIIGSINLNVDVGDDEEDEVQEIRRPIGKDKAKGSMKKKGQRASGSSSTNDDALARLMVSEMAMHNEHAIEMQREERKAFLEIKTREVECRERELAN